MEELNGSELGTLEYWQKSYSEEIKNFESCGDFGDVWFGEDSVQRVTDWIVKSYPNKDVKVIDIGCGNGYSLLELGQAGFTNLTGIDYSAEAIELAKKIAIEKYPFINYKLFDILTEDLSELEPPYCIVHDKGTYDAISLCPESANEKRISYIQKIYSLIDNNSIFLITSCNWTQEELSSHFEGYFKLKCVLPTPQYKFGGKVGNVFTSLVFVRK